MNFHGVDQLINIVFFPKLLRDWWQKSVSADTSGSWM